MMTSGEKIQFVKELVDSVRQGVINDILEEKIPGEWNGHELRCLLAERFQRCVYTMDKKRKAEYDNTVLVNNL
jgi:hypothetical protein